MWSIKSYMTLPAVIALWHSIGAPSATSELITSVMPAPVLARVVLIFALVSFCYLIGAPPKVGVKKAGVRPVLVRALVRAVLMGAVLSIMEYLCFKQAATALIVGSLAASILMIGPVARLIDDRKDADAPTNSLKTTRK